MSKKVVDLAVEAGQVLLKKRGGDLPGGGDYDQNLQTIPRRLCRYIYYKPC